MQERLTAENAQLRLQIKKLEQELGAQFRPKASHFDHFDALNAAARSDLRRQSWQNKEAELLRQVELAAEKLETFTKELAVCKQAQQDCEVRLRDAHHGNQHREEQVKASI